jgi:heterodisulfide reductase subunit A
MSSQKAALVIGGGVAGMTAALSLADQGFPVHLVERDTALGGNLRHLHYTTGDVSVDHTARFEGWRSTQEYLSNLVARVHRQPLITTHLETELVDTGGFVGNFTSVLERHVNGPSTSSGHGSSTDPGQVGVERVEVQHGATIVATGGVEYRGNEYGLGRDPRIITQQEFERLLAGEANPGTTDHPGTPDRLPNSVVMIQCVGPAETYCSRICCSVALKNALMLKQLKPDAQVTVIYRDIRTYGFKEELYTAARRAGVRFVRYDFDRKPEVEPFDELRTDSADGHGDGTPQGELGVRVWEPILQMELRLTPDLLVLSMPIVPSPGARDLASRLKVPVDMDGFFMEAHVKLRPVDFSSDGVFMAGMAHYPKLLDETIVQARAAAARAATLLAQDTRAVGGRVAVVDAAQCVGCLTCVRTCPYGAPRIVDSLTGVGGILGAARIEIAMCHGCGLCAVACPAKAIELMHYTDVQVLAKVDALFAPERAFQYGTEV